MLGARWGGQLVLAGVVHASQAARVRESTSGITAEQAGALTVGMWAFVSVSQVAIDWAA